MFLIFIFLLSLLHLNPSTAQGFIFVSSVIQGDEDAPSSPSRLRNLYHLSLGGIKINPSCLKNIQSKILPWMESPAEAIRCYDTVSTQSSSLCISTPRCPFSCMCSNGTGPPRLETSPPIPLHQTPENENWVVPILPDYSNESDGSDIKLCMKGIVQEKCSFRFQDFAL